MSAISRLLVRTVVFENGERMAMLVDADSGLPDFDACLYASTKVRPRSGSCATIEQALRGVRLAKYFVAAHDIDLQERLATGQFLKVHELDELVTAAYRPLSAIEQRAEKSEPAHRRIVSIEHARRRAPKMTEGPKAADNTAATRLHYACNFIYWLGQRHCAQVCETVEHKDTYTRLLDTFRQELRARTPVSRTPVARTSLTKEQKRELLRVIDPRCPENPWHGEFVRDRNRLIVMWGLGTGLRRGELLGLRIRSLDFLNNMASILRQQDDPQDPRKYQPNTKTRERKIGISEGLAFLTHEHVVKYRSRLKGATRHDILFVARRTGQPLSLTAFTKVFRSLQTCSPLLGRWLSSHVFRYTWNEDFSEVVDAVNLPENEERRARNHAMGWSDQSNTADHYLERRTARVATEASKKVQRAVMGGVSTEPSHVGKRKRSRS